MNYCNVLDGKALASKIRSELKKDIETSGIECGLAVILVGEDAASQIYVKNKIKACDDTGIKSYAYYMPAEVSQSELDSVIEMLNADDKINGILVQLPLPPHLDERHTLEQIRVDKDVDGFSVDNAGKLFLGEKDALMPCTPSGVMELIKSANISIAGKKAVVIGRSNIVGKPLAMMLLAANATVTIAHSRTVNLGEITRDADIVVSAVGIANILKADMVKEGATVIDVGINRTECGLCGDVEFGSVSQKAACITPVPGGVGPMTIAMLLKNTVTAALRQSSLRK